MVLRIFARWRLVLAALLGRERAARRARAVQGVVLFRRVRRANTTRVVARSFQGSRACTASENAECSMCELENTCSQQRNNPPPYQAEGAHKGISRMSAVRLRTGVPERIKRTHCVYGRWCRAQKIGSSCGGLHIFCCGRRSPSS